MTIGNTLGIIKTNVWDILRRDKKWQVQILPHDHKNSAQRPAAAYQVSGKSTFKRAELQSNYVITMEHGVR